jgi:hypothetical protein
VALLKASRVDAKRRLGEARLHARVLEPGELRVGDRIERVEEALTVT